MRNKEKELKFCHPIIGPHPKACPEESKPHPPPCLQGEILVDGVCYTPIPKPLPVPKLPECTQEEISIYGACRILPSPRPPASNPQPVTMLPGYLQEEILVDGVCKELSHPVVEVQTQGYKNVAANNFDHSGSDMLLGFALLIAALTGAEPQA